MINYYQLDPNGTVIGFLVSPDPVDASIAAANGINLLQVEEFLDEGEPDLSITRRFTGEFSAGVTDVRNRSTSEFEEAPASEVPLTWDGSSWTP